MFWFVVLILACVILSITYSKREGCLIRGVICVLLFGTAILFFSLELYLLGGAAVFLAFLSLFIKPSFKEKNDKQKDEHQELKRNTTKELSTIPQSTNSYTPISYGRAHYSQFYQPVYVYPLASISDYEINNIIEVKALRSCPAAITPSLGNFSLWNSSDKEKLAYKKIREDFLEGKIYDLQQSNYLGYVEELCEDVFKALLRHEKDPRYVWWVMKRILMMNPAVITKMHQVVGWYKDEYVVSETYKQILYRKPELQDKTSWLEIALLTYKLNIDDYISIKRVYGNRQKILNECSKVKNLIVKIYIQTLRAAGESTRTKISTFYKQSQNFHRNYIYTDIMHKCTQAIQNSVRSRVYNRPMTTQFKSEIDEELTNIFAPLVLDDLINKYAEAIFPLPMDVWEEFKTWIPALAKKTNLSPSIVTPERKHIQIDTERVASQAEQFHQVVDKLSDIMAEEDEIPIPNAVKEEKKEETPIQVDLLMAFAGNGFVLTKNQLNEIAKQLNTMPSALIDRINEQYYEQLDDILIEEEEDTYTMNEEYYNSIK